MHDYGIPKNQDQRKVRQEAAGHKVNGKIRGGWRILGSLDSVNWRQQEPQPGGLRRTRSLAVNHRQSRPGQPLIPRARLIDARHPPRDHRHSKQGRSVEDLQSYEETQAEPPYLKSGSLLAANFRHRHQQADRSRSEYQYQYCSLVYEESKTRLRRSARSRSSHEDLQSINLSNCCYNTNNKNSECSLSDTNDDVSLALEEDYLTNSQEDKQYALEDENYPRRHFELDEADSIPYDDNIILSTNKPLYNSLSKSVAPAPAPAKPKTIRGLAAYDIEETHFKSRSLPVISNIDQLCDNHISTEDINDIVFDYFETNKNNPEVSVEKFDTYHVNEKSQSEDSSDVASGPIYATIDENSPLDKDNEQHFNFELNQDNNKNKINNEADHTDVENSIYGSNKVEKIDTNESIVQPDQDDNNSSKKHHSHNYLREFLETQKGSKKPLQTYLTKKFSHNSPNSSKKSLKKLISSPFASLPNINVDNNLRKYAQIDQNLRDSENKDFIKKGSGSGSGSGSTKENRFIVNIGKHFDITANSSVPLDFEVKISRFPKKSKLNRRESFNPGSVSKSSISGSLKHLKEAYNSATKHIDQSGTKPEIIALKIKNQEKEKHKKGNKKDKSKNSNTLYNGDENFDLEIKPSRKQTNKENLEHYRVAATDKNMENSEKTSNNNRVPIYENKINSKVDDAKKIFEPVLESDKEKQPSKIQLAKQLFEPKKTDKKEKLSPMIKRAASFFSNGNNHNSYENQHHKNSEFESLQPQAVEIIEKSCEGQESKPRNKNKYSTMTKSRIQLPSPEFDHVRYRVIKSNLFQKSIYAKCEKESQFEGLMQYLQDYSFQELLCDNNIVIIEPIRSRINHEASKVALEPRGTRNVTSLVHRTNEENINNGTIGKGSGIRKHFFYSPVRVNKEVNDDELPNPETVKQVRQFFETGTKRRSKSSENLEEIRFRPERSTNLSSTSQENNAIKSGENDNKDSETLDEPHNKCCDWQYVSEEVLRRIRRHGSTVTYYGGRIVEEQTTQPSLTKVIMEEIKNSQQRNRECLCSNRHARSHPMTGHQEQANNQKVKFKLLKSNSCSSRLEIVGTTASANSPTTDRRLDEPFRDYNDNLEIENEELPHTNGDTPRFSPADNKNIVQWNQLTNSNLYSQINYSTKQSQKAKYSGYQDYNKVDVNKNKVDEMEFEPYQVA